MMQGEIWYASLDPTEGSEQAGFRPVLIVSGNLANEFALVVLCCPITTKIKNYKGNPILDPNKQNGLKQKSEVMVIDLRSSSKNRLKQQIGTVDAKEIKQIKLTINDLLNY
ncbi:MAG: type II toxin-antitoxin system PemK/MazF family toxin [Bacteroidia bacterium]